MEEVGALAMGFPNISSNISGEDGIEPLQNGVGEEAEERMEESLREVEKAAEAQGSARAEEPEGHIEMTEAEGSWGAVEAKEPEGSSGDEDTSGRTGKGPSAGIRGWVGDSCVPGLGGGAYLACVSGHRWSWARETLKGPLLGWS